jgi:hypothetical protein
MRRITQGLVEQREDGDLQHGFSRTVRCHTDGLHREFPPTRRVEVAVDNHEGTACDVTAWLKYHEIEIEIGQFGGRAADLSLKQSKRSESRPIRHQMIDRAEFHSIPFPTKRSYRRSFKEDDLSCAAPWEKMERNSFWPSQTLVMNIVLVFQGEE